MTSDGWTICWAPNINLQVMGGTSYCHLDVNGCATDGAGDHGNNEYCTIRVAANGFLTATQFNTESGYDYVTIDGTRYQGSTGPSGVAVAAGSNFTWHSDLSVTNAGWTICLSKMRSCDPTVDRPQTSLGDACIHLSLELAWHGIGASPVATHAV